MAASETLTTVIIENIRKRAESAGDSDRVAVCDRALSGDRDARAECDRWIRNPWGKVLDLDLEKTVIEVLDPTPSDWTPKDWGAYDLTVKITLQDNREFAGGVTVVPNRKGGYVPVGGVYPAESWVDADLARNLFNAVDEFGALEKLLKAVAKEACRRAEREPALPAWWRA